MDMKGEERISAPREVVWEALNDPDVLKACIPGCQTLEKTSDTSFSATVQAKVGPVKAKFAGEVSLTDIDPPKGYKISGEGKGGAAGFAKGGAVVSLAEDGDETVLSYEVDANVGGKLAQIGSRLIDSTAKKMAGEFFSKFNEEVMARAGDAGSAPAAADTEAAATAAAAPSPTPAPVEEPAPAAPVEAPVEAPAAEPAAKQAEAPAPASDTDVKAAAAKAATEAVNETSAKRKGLSPVIWVLAVIVAAGLLIYSFNS
ncbi:carbon monoxide dehydrogenase [Hwanghaeella grinnelliae]|uniref:Carbon monoxide dehydrogenase n=1 Tax=Hwanghaeella grinnelliae TaxID=2500179 RepID=A0A3S2VMK5_9PROT|nr:carbon monoxide dehydrogenase subunit G [Hwanghaeella grinnelliae]RVU33885.1 carbon monoxide dehydrogenase [Hwanghaeella grinnelliae]